MKNLETKAERRIKVVGYVIFSIIIYFVIEIALQIGNHPDRITYGSF